MAKKRVFSGIQPSGDMHIGNYLGAILTWVRNQDEKENIFCIVDEHAITVPQDPEMLRRRTLDLAKVYIAAGIDPKKCAIFVQSSRPEHAELGWILNNFVYVGELNKMTQFKEKGGKNRVKSELKKVLTRQKNYTLKYIETRLAELSNAQTGTDEWFESIMLGIQKGQFDSEIDNTIDQYFVNEASVGLFDYPVLMAADILLYDTDEVPVGEDQKQHVEITKVIASRVNKRYSKKILTIPTFTTNAAATRIMSLTDPTKKMSKSDENAKSRIELLDSPEAIRKKLASAVTDSGNEIVYDKDKKPGISNLLNILSVSTGTPVKKLEKQYVGVSYGDFKKDVAKAVIAMLTPFQARYAGLTDTYVTEVLRDGAKRVAPQAKETLKRVKDAVGLGI